MSSPNIPPSAGYEGGQAPSLVSGAFPMGVYRATPTALADGDAGPFLLDSAGAIVISGGAPAVGTGLQAIISVNTATDHVIALAAGAGNYLALRKINFVVAGAVNVTLLRCNAAGTVFTAITGVYTFAAAGGGLALDFDSYPLTTGDNEGLGIRLSGAVLVGGVMVYTVETT